MNAQARDDNLQTDKLKRDIRQAGDNAGNGDGQRQSVTAETAAHKISRRNIAFGMGDRPKPRKHRKQDRIDQHHSQNGEKARRAGPEHQGRDGHESIGGVHVAAQNEPGDDGSEAPTAQAPFVQLFEIALVPSTGNKTDNGGGSEQQDKNGDRRRFNLAHGELRLSHR